MKKRVLIPTNPELLLALAQRVEGRHLADGDASLLKPLNWKVLAETLVLNEQAERARREMHDAYEKRKQGLKNVAKLLRGSRDILTAVQQDNMKALGLWGFDVMERTSKGAETPEQPTTQPANQ